MTFNQLKLAVYSTFLTNWYGLKLRKLKTLREKKELRGEYCLGMLESLNMEVKVINPEKIPTEGNYLLASNHRTIIDPPIIEVATMNSSIQGYWISKKELYDSFFGMSSFFKEVKQRVSEGDSRLDILPVYIRN